MIIMLKPVSLVEPRNKSYAMCTARWRCAGKKMFTLQLIRRSTGILLCLLALAPAGAKAQSKEYQVKAAFLFNFAQFVQWPDTVFASSDSPFCIGILGDDPFGKALDETIRGETIQGHKMTIQRARQVIDLKNCQIIFVSKSEKSKVPEILAAVGSRPVLTVGDVPGFARNGGGINFFLEGGKVRFEINSDATKTSGLRFDPQLLSLGRIVATGKEGK